jgi:hypothetical protein
MDILERRARALTVNAILKDENAIKVQTDRQTESDRPIRRGIIL